MVSHEFRTSVSNISAALEIIERRSPGGVNESEYARIRHAINKLCRLIETCAFEDRICSGTDLETTNHVDIGDIIREVIEEIVPPVRTNDVHLKMNVGPYLLISDRTLVSTALSNLIDNAIKFSAVGSAVEIEVNRRDTHLTFTVADRGPGVPESERHAIFQKFYRSSTSERTPGSGLGLHIVKQVAEYFNGLVSVTGREGGGAEFTLQISNEKL